MREIKFRGKNKKNNKLAYGYLIKHSYLNKYYIYEMMDNTGCWRSEVIPETISQFTGLKDKNGVEIYEGDIVNFHLFTQELGVNYGVTEGEKEFKGYICFEELGLAFKQSEEDEDWFYLVYSPGMMHEESFEVIGNIHSNPELLK